MTLLCNDIVDISVKEKRRFWKRWREGGSKNNLKELPNEQLMTGREQQEKRDLEVSYDGRMIE